MKKITAFFLTLMLTLNMSFTLASAETTISSKEKNMLASLGIAEEINENTYLTRDRYAEIILSCYGYDSENINLAATMEFLGLYDNGDYNWAGYATFGETVRGIVSLLGYDLEMRYFSKNALDFVQKGHELGITTGINKNFDDKITEEEFAKMIIKAIDTPVMMGKYENGSFNIDVYEDESFLTKRHNIYYAKGQITANEHSTLSSPNGIGNGKVQIGDIEYFVGNTNAADLLGYYVEYYYYAEDDEYTLVWVYADSQKNNELYLETDDIVQFVPEKLTYELNGREKTAKIVSGASYIYNGKAASIADIPSLKPEIGEVTLTDSDGDNYYDSVIIMNYEVALVDDINTKESILYVRGSAKTKYEFEERENFHIYNEKYEEKALTSLSKDNVLWIAESLDEDVLTILVSTKTVDGKISGLGKDAYGRDIMTIDDEDYLLATVDTSKPSIGEECTFYLDIAGNIAYFKAKGSDYKIGWLLSAYPADENDEIFMVKMFDGSVSIYECTDNFSFNGVKKLSYDSIVNTLKNGQNSMAQIIRYKLNSDNKITFLQTATQASEEKDRLFVEGYIPRQGEGGSHPGALFKKNLGNFFTNYFALEDNATVLIIPGDPLDYDKYVIGGPDLITNDSTVYGITGYKLNPEDDRCIAAVYDKTISAGGANARQPSVVKKISEVLTDKDEIGYEIEYYDLSIAPATITEKVAKTDKAEFITDTGIEVGDTIRIDVDTDGNITGLERIYNAKDKELIRNTRDIWGSQFRGNTGKVASKQSNSIKIKTDTAYPAKLTMEYIPLDYTAVYISETNKKGIRELKVGSRSDIMLGDTVIYTQRVGQDFRLIVYK